MQKFIFPALVIGLLVSPFWARAGVDLPWSTTYNCADWNQYSDPLNCDNLRKKGSWVASPENHNEQITASANYPGGAGGKGQRHWIGDGTNNNSGGTQISFNTPPSKIWMRWYMRWEPGFKEFGQYKAIYGFSSTGSNGPLVNFFYPGGGMSFEYLASGNETCNNCGWGTDFYQSGVSDGSWVYVEAMMDAAAGKLKLWVGPQQRLVIDRSGVQFKASKMGYYVVGQNQKNVSHGRSMYIDYDDIAISTTGYIGPIGGGGSDTTPPNSNITSPAQNATVSGSVNITANATDNVGVVGVQFKINGVNTGAEDTASPFSVSLDTTTLVNGSHSITAVARDAAANQTTSAAVSVIASNGDITAPSISLSSPAQGANISGSVSLTANASDDVAVVGVQFKIDGANVGSEDTTSPYAKNLDSTTLTNGSHSVTAIARDAAANQTTSSSISINVNNSSDSTAPTISVTSPSQGATVSGSLNLSANATDNVGVVGVQFKINGANTGNEDTTSPYGLSFDTTTYSDGSYTVTAVARDAASNQTTSSSVNFTIGNGGSITPLISEPFENSSFSSRGWYDNTNLILSSTEYIPGSTKSAEFYFSQGATKPTSGAAIRHQFDETDSVYLSYYVKYSANWVGSTKNYHPHEFFFMTNLDTAYVGMASTRLTVYVEQNSLRPLFNIQDSINIDSNNIGNNLVGQTETRAVGGCNGDSDGNGDGDCYQSGMWRNDKHWLYDSAVITAGQWHKVEAYFKLNSIASGIGQQDGIMKYWLNGNLLLDYSNIVFRTGQHPGMLFNQIAIAPYIGDGSPVNQTMWVDDFILSKTAPGSTIPPTISKPQGFKKVVP